MGLARATETALCLIEDKAYVSDQNGQAISTEKAIEFFDLVWEIISEVLKYSNENCSNIPSETNLKVFFVEKASAKGVSEEDQRLILQMGEVRGAFIGGPWDK